MVWMEWRVCLAGWVTGDADGAFDEHPAMPTERE